uniref:Uncharacterized protein n=1 Tax=Globodera pallida TaxID=36090 RepID=A0A183CMB8_GLOPA
MPWDCGLLCLFTERRRHIEVLWRRRLLVTDDERKAKRRFLNLMRGFDTEDLDVLRKPSAAALSLLTISVGAGWGANYECRCATDLPCRYEVIFM